jgi:hypothetical protein
MKAQKVTRLALKHLWAPVGSPVMPAEETRFLLEYLLGGDQGRALARRIDRRVAALPGMQGLRVVEATLTKRGISDSYAPARLPPTARRAPELVGVR